MSLEKVKDNLYSILADFRKNKARTQEERVEERLNASLKLYCEELELSYYRLLRRDPLKRLNSLDKED